MFNALCFYARANHHHRWPSNKLHALKKVLFFRTELNTQAVILNRDGLILIL